MKEYLKRIKQEEDRVLRIRENELMEQAIKELTALIKVEKAIKKG